MVRAQRQIDVLPTDRWRARTISFTKYMSEFFFSSLTMVHVPNEKFSVKKILSGYGRLCLANEI